MKNIVICFLGIIIFSTGCSSGLHGTNATPIVEGDVLTFMLNYGNANGLLGASLSIDGEKYLIWQKSLNYFHDEFLEYGKLAPELREKKLILELVWQYDDFMAASMTTEQYEFNVSKKGEIIDLKKRKY